MSDTVQTRDTPVIQLHPADNVAVRRLPAGAAVANDVAAREPIPSGHKVSVAPIAAGEAVRRYGQVIGAATQPIPAGAHVHVHNLATSQLRAEPELRKGWRNESPRSFWGIGDRTGARGYATISASSPA
jgi:altronate hydrolase